MRIALTDVLPDGRAGATVVHLADPYDDELTLCSQYEDGRVADRRTTLDVDCMTCLVHASRPTLADAMAAAMRLPKEFLYGYAEDDGANDR